MTDFKWAGPNLDKNSVRLSEPALFYENYTSLDFDSKHLNTNLSRERWNFLGPSLQRKSSFWTTPGAALMFWIMSRSIFVINIFLNFFRSILQGSFWSNRVVKKFSEKKKPNYLNVLAYFGYFRQLFFQNVSANMVNRRDSLFLARDKMCKKSLKNLTIF